MCSLFSISRLTSHGLTSIKVSNLKNPNHFTVLTQSLHSLPPLNPVLPPTSSSSSPLLSSPQFKIKPYPFLSHFPILLVSDSYHLFVSLASFLISFSPFRIIVFLLLLLYNLTSNLCSTPPMKLELE